MVKHVVDAKEARTFVPALHVNCTARALLEEANVGCKNLTMLRSEFKQGGYADRHAHTFEQSYYILKGRASITIGDEEYSVKAGMAMTFPPNVMHSIKNTGKGEMWLIAVNTPPK